MPLCPELRGMAVDLIVDTWWEVTGKRGSLDQAQLEFSSCTDSEAEPKRPLSTSSSSVRLTHREI